MQADPIFVSDIPYKDDEYRGAPWARASVGGRAFLFTSILSYFLCEDPASRLKSPVPPLRPFNQL